MKKVFSGLLAILALTCTTYAFSATTIPSQLTNSFYMGANVDYLWINFNHQIQRRVPPGQWKSANDKQSGITGGIDAGYTWYNPNVSWALELFYDYDDVSHTHMGTTTSTRKQLQYDIGLQIHLGHVFNRGIFPYTIIGVNYGHFKYRALPVIPGGTRVDNQYSEPGITVGAGVNIPLYQHFRARIAYEFSHFASKNNISTDASYYLRKGDSNTNEISFGIAYSF